MADFSALASVVTSYSVADRPASQTWVYVGARELSW
jgi:hypothetical protein